MNDRIRVLLVDDEDRFCKITSTLLIKNGFDTVVANTAEQAIHILNQSPKDVVILDLIMNGMDGHTALNEIKKIDPDIQVIMLTGHGSKYSAMRALVREAFDYLAKPCDIQVLASRIKDAHAAKQSGFKIDHKKVVDIMTPIDTLVTVRSDITVKKALVKMTGTIDIPPVWPSGMEKSPGIVMVMDTQDIFAGVLTKMDIIKAVRPEYVEAGDSPHQESARFSSIFWSGFFSDRVTAIAQRPVKEIMSGLPPVISENANLLEVANQMWKESKRLLMVRGVYRLVGIVQDQDIFWEIAAAIQARPPS